MQQVLCQHLGPRECAQVAALELGIETTPGPSHFDRIGVTVQGMLGVSV